jgi:hypothetical protein
MSNGIDADVTEPRAHKVATGREILSGREDLRDLHSRP